MNYQQIVDTALGYADRQDSEIVNNIPLFLKMVEARINRILSTQKMSTTMVTPLISGVSVYPLPPDYLALILAGFVTTAPGLNVLAYLTPRELAESMLSDQTAINNQNFIPAYTVSGNMLKLNFVPSDDYATNNSLSVEYYQQIPPLVPLDPLNPSVVDSNWISTLNPDCYIFGLLVEINAFVKDATAVPLWDARFKETLESIEVQDSTYVWGGPALTVRVC